MTARYIISVFLSLWFFLPVGLVTTSTAADLQRISRDELRSIIDSPDLVIIDVRTEREWKKADLKIKGAVWEDADEVSSWAGKYPKDKRMVLYCS